MRYFLIWKSNMFTKWFLAARWANWIQYFLLHHCEDCSLNHEYNNIYNLTSKDGKETEHDGIEEAEAHGQGVLVDNSRDDEHREHCSCSEFPFRQLQGSEKEHREVLAQSSGVRLVHWGICVTRITGQVLNYFTQFIMWHAALEIYNNTPWDITLFFCLIFGIYSILYVILICCVGTLLTQRKSLYP